MVSLRILPRSSMSRLALKNCLIFSATAAVFICLRYFYSNNYAGVFETLTANPTTENVATVLNDSNGFLAATMTNIGKLSSSPVCVVDPAITECSGMGFGAFLLLTLDQIQICHSLGIHHPVVFWRGCNSACSRKRMINSWLWYFEPVNPGLELQVEKVMCPFFTDGKGASILDSSFQNRSMVTGYDNSKIITKMTRMKVNKLIKHYARPNSEILERVRAIYNRQFSGYNMLGVHVRGTDHWYETPQHRLPSIMNWVQRAWKIFETLPQPKKIFIASDNDEVIRKFKTVFGKQTIVSINAVRAKRYHSELPPNLFKYNLTDSFARAVGTQVLMDILLLAKCEHFLHAESSVASLASFFNPYMKSYFMEETHFKGQEQDHTKNTQNEWNRIDDHQEDSDPEDWLENDVLQCFLENYATSICSNAAKGIFVNWEGATSFLKGQ
ncbi:uncharacterized protein [Montipora capricornis]|uniref:uncharacterized protein isoform X1 n=1 Tax=Montipora capricornis TaxID=246305 RepID=UPI0035F20C79